MLTQGQLVLVQVLRDPNRGKGATLTTFLSLAGRLLVSMPSLARVGVSRRIQDQDERKRLIEALGESPGGVIVRTAGEGLPKRELQKDLRHLQKRWTTLEEGARLADKPGLLLAEDSPAVRAVREMFTNDVGRVVVDEPQTAKQVADFLAEWAPHADLQVEHYERTRPLFESLDIERDYQTLFRARVPIGSGASIVIHETEALCAIDVNSGRLGRSSLEETARDTNMLAAREIARQIHLRDLGGIIVVDFIDMTKAEHRREVEGAFRSLLRENRSRMRAGHLGSFGLMSLTRRRRGTGLPRASEAMCRGCGGSGSVGHHGAGAMRVLRRLRAETEGDWVLRGQPGVVAEFKAHYAQIVRTLPIQLTYKEDSQVPAGEPVIERQ
jgi:ribonuclease E